MSSDYTTEPTQSKVCIKCHETKEIGCFGKHTRQRDGLQTECRACRSAYYRAYRTAKPDKVQGIRRKYRKENPERVIESQIKYRKEHFEKVIESRRKWNTRNPDKLREKKRRRRARQANAEGSHTITDMRRQYKAQKGLCWWCSKPVKWDDRHDDHLIPLSKGGTDWPNNIVISCAHCNLSKNDKLPDEFIGRLF